MPNTILNVLDQTQAGRLIKKIFDRVVKITDTTPVDTIGVDNVPTKNSQNLVNSNGVYSEIHPASQSSQPVGGMLPNVLYNLGTLTGTVTIAFASPSDANVENEYKFTFDTDTTAPTITFPNSITAWVGNCLSSNVPDIKASKHYEVSVEDGVAFIVEV